MPSFKCTDIGIKDNFEVKDDNPEELTKIVELHAKTSHNITRISPEIKE